MTKQLQQKFDSDVAVITTWYQKAAPSKPSSRESLEGFTSLEGLVAQVLGRMWSTREIRHTHHPVCHFYVSIKHLVKESL